MTITNERAPTVQRRLLRHPATAPAAVGLLAFAISLVGIAVPSVWYDEAATITSATRTLPQLWSMIGTVDAVHAVYYAGMHLWFELVGYSPITLRLPSTAAIGLAAAGVVVLGRQLGSTRLGLIAGLVFAIMPRVTWAGIEGRSYALTALLAVAMTIALVTALTDPRRRWWAVYGGLALVSVLVSVYLALVVVGHAATVLWWASRHRQRRALVGFAVSAGAAAVLASPLVLEIVGQRGQVDWIDPIDDSTLDDVFRWQWFMTGTGFAVVALALIAIGLVVAARRGPGRFEIVVLPGLLTPTLVLLLVTAVSTPLYQPRYLTMGTPFAALAVAAGIAALRPRPLVPIALAALLALAVPAMIDQRQPQVKDGSAWPEVAQLITDDRADHPGTAAFIYGALYRHPSATTRTIAYSYPDAFADSIDVTLIQPAAESGRLWERWNTIDNTADRLADADVAYLITSTSRDQRPETVAALAREGWEVTQRWELPRLHVLRFERIG